MFKRMVDFIIAYQERRAAYYVLTHMSDKDLKDMGVTRGEIRQRVYGKH